MSAGWIKKSQESDSRLHKEEVLRQALAMALLGNANADNFLKLVQSAYHPMITFGIKQVNDTVGYVDRENPWEEFRLLLLVDLRNRAVTGNDAHNAITAMSERFDSEEWNTICAPTLRKDLRCGISDKTINKVCKGSQYEIPVFSCQLATNCEDRPEMIGVKRLEPKLDGVRVLFWCYRTYGQTQTATVDTEPQVAIVAFSRNGKVFENFGHIESQLANNMDSICRLVGHNSFFLDGEVVGQSFNDLMRQARRKTDVDAVDSVFYPFDFIPTVDFDRGHWNAQLYKRLAILNKIKPVLGEMPNIKFLDSIEVDLSVNSGRDQLQRYANDCVHDGYEGIMIKSLNAPYICKRSTYWMKWKPTITVDLSIVSLEEGTGKNVGRLGAFVCEGTDHGKTISVNVGSGISDSEREQYWLNKDSIIGNTIEILCDSVSQNQDGTYSLRFPRFLRFRDDK